MPILGPAPAAGAAPDWPLIEYAVCWSAGPNDTPVQDSWCNLSSRTEGQTTVRRGKQYELDQVQPGEMTLTLRNDDGAFDPTNTGSPFYPQVKPYRLIRLRAQSPATVNLLTAAQASPPSTSLPQWVYPWNTTTLAAVVGGYNVTYTVGTLNPGARFTGWSVQPGGTYTGQALIGSFPSGSGYQVGLDWRDCNGNHLSYTWGTVLTGIGLASPVTVTGTAPAGAVAAGLIVQQTASVAGDYTFSNVQVEQNSTASSWVQPGTWYSLFTGYVERWPQGWSSGGNYGTIAANCVDLFAFLANAPLLDPFAADLLALNPNFLYELNEAQGTTVFQDLTGKRGPAIVAPTALANTLVAGQSLTSGDNAPPGQANPSLPLTGAFLGGQGPVVQTALPLSGSGAPEVGGGALLIPPDPNTGMVGPPSFSAYTRIIAVRATGVPPANRSAYAWDYYNAKTGDDCSFYIPNSQMKIWTGTGEAGSFNSYTDIGLPAVANPSTAAMIDTDWHLIGAGWSAINGSTGTFNYYVDDHLVGSYSNYPGGSGNMARPSTPNQGGRDCIGAQADGQTVGQNWIGDIAFVCEIPAGLTQAQWRALYASWRNAWANGSNNGAVETSGDRYARILGWIGYTGPSRVDTGSSVDYGPATDITGGSNPTYALQALQNVVSTEFGQHYVAADGTIVFQARTDRYNPAPTVSFGEHSGEIPYTGAKMDFDPTRIANQIEVDAQYGNAPYFATDATSQDNYGQVGLQWTANSLSPEELQDGAGYLLYQNKQPLQRLEALPVDVGANPSVWGTLLGLDLGQPVTVNRRPSNAPAMSQVGFVEQVSWSIDDARKVSWTAQVSNAAAHYFGTLDDPTYGKFDSTLIFGF